MIDDDPIDVYWDALSLPRTASGDSVSKKVDVTPVFAWARALGAPGKSPFLTLPPEGGVFNQLKTTVDSEYLAVNADWLLPVEFLRTLLRRLIFTHDLIIEDRLQEMVNESVCLLRFHQIIWEGRFLLQENPHRIDAYIQGHMQTLTFTGLEMVSTLCFLTTLAAQNGLFKRLILMCSGSASIMNRRAAKDFTAQLSVVRRWALLCGTPLGLIFESYDKTDLSRLRKLDHTLSVEIETGMSWLKNT